MDKLKFEELAQAYGGEIGRWPAKMRDDAALLVAAEPDFARAVLARESELDAVLDDLPRVTASADLFERIVTSAPPLRPRLRWSLWIAPAGLSAGLAAIAAAGVMLGAQVGAEVGAQTGTAVTGESSQAVADLDVSAISEEG